VGVEVAVGVAVAVEAGVEVGVGVKVAVGVGDAVVVDVGVRVAVEVGVEVAVGIAVAVGVSVGTGLWELVELSVLIAPTVVALEVIVLFAPSSTDEPQPARTSRQASTRAVITVRCRIVLGHTEPDKKSVWLVDPSGVSTPKKRCQKNPDAQSLVIQGGLVTK
jgi:hypothetical protein